MADRRTWGRQERSAAAAVRALESGFRVLRVAGSQFEETISFAGLHQIVHPLGEKIRELEPGQVETLNTVLGYSGGQPSELLGVANATLALLRRAGTPEAPLLLVIDDVAWLDRPTALVLSIVARYIRPTPVGLLAASRTSEESFLSGSGMPLHEVLPLDDDAAASLVEAHFPAMAPRVRQRLLAEARGNPLALLELPVALDDMQRDERRPLPVVLPLSERLQAIFSSRVAHLPEVTRRLLLLAVLDGTGDLHVLRKATDAPDGLNDLSAAERARLVQVDFDTGRLSFRHPLTRSAIMELSTSAERRLAHRTLASLLPERSERRIRHLADSVVGPDDQVAALLDDVAYSTLRRGDAVGAITTLLHASELSGVGAERGRRLAEAAYLGANVTGDLRNVRALLDDARRADPEGPASLAAAVAAASQLLNWEGDIDTAHRLLVRSIEHHPQRLPGCEHALSEALRTLLLVCFFSGRIELWHSFDTAVSHLALPTADPILFVLSSTFSDPARRALPALGQLDQLIGSLHLETDPTHIIKVAMSSSYVDRLPGCRSALRHVVEDGRRGGAVASSIEALFLLANDAFMTGQWDELKGCTEEGLQLCTTYNYRLLSCSGYYFDGMHAAVRGDEETARTLADKIYSWGAPRGLGALSAYASHIRAMSSLGNGDFYGAYQHLSRITTAGELGMYVPHELWLILDFVEASARSGRYEEATAHAEAVREAGLSNISPRLAMVTAGAKAMANPRILDRDSFEKAIETPGAERWSFDLARIQLAYGEGLRRLRANVEARKHLTTALSLFQRLGAQPWITRTASELRASGFPSKDVNVRGGQESLLTPQEREIAQLAATGMTNKQIAERMFLSPRTVATHLHNAFPKLNITSRAGLRDALAALPESSDIPRA